MALGFLVYRRDLPGGRFVMITLEDEGAEVVGRLSLERRTDPGRQGEGLPPAIAEARGATRAEVLDRLRSVAESDDQLSEVLEDWAARRR